MSQLYRKVDLRDGIPVQFVGKYVLSSDPEMTVGFVEVEKGKEYDGSITITMKKFSWMNICETARQSDINTLGNFWTAIQIIEEKMKNGR